MLDFHDVAAKIQSWLAYIPDDLRADAAKTAEDLHNHADNLAAAAVDSAVEHMAPAIAPEIVPLLDKLLVGALDAIDATLSADVAKLTQEADAKRAELAAARTHLTAAAPAAA